MSLSSGSLDSVVPGVGMLALAGYLLAAWPGARAAAWAGHALWAALLAHLLMLSLDIGSIGLAGSSARLGFGPVLSLTVCLVVGVHAIESRLVPVPRVRRMLAMAGVAAVALVLAFPGEVRTLGSAGAPLHWLLGVAAYGLFGAAVLHGLLLDESERRLRRHRAAAALSAASPTMPLLQLERITFRFVQVGFAVLTVAIVFGAVTARQWRFDHKTVLSLWSWGIFAALLVGRQRRGWRGRQATRWLYAGALVLLLAYAGTRFVTEVVLNRSGGV